MTQQQTTQPGGNFILRGLTTIVLAAAIVGGVAGPAGAAGSTTLPDIRGCFTWGPSHVAYANQPVFLEYWDGVARKWVVSRSATTASNGCIQFNDVTRQYYTIVGYRFFGYPNCYYYYGASIIAGPMVRNDTLWRTGYTQLTGPYSLSPC